MAEATAVFCGLKIGCGTARVALLSSGGAAPPDSRWGLPCPPPPLHTEPLRTPREGGVTLPTPGCGAAPPAARFAAPLFPCASEGFGSPAPPCLSSAGPAAARRGLGPPGPDCAALPALCQRALPSVSLIIFGPFLPCPLVSELCAACGSACAVCVTEVVRADSGCAVRLSWEICVTAASCVRTHPLDSVLFPHKSCGPLSQGKASARSGIPLTPGLVPTSCWVAISGLSGGSDTVDTDGTGGETAPPSCTPSAFCCANSVSLKRFSASYLLTIASYITLHTGRTFAVVLF